MKKDKNLHIKIRDVLESKGYSEEDSFKWYLRRLEPSKKSIESKGRYSVHSLLKEMLREAKKERKMY